MSSSRVVSASSSQQQGPRRRSGDGSGAGGGGGGGDGGVDDGKDYLCDENVALVTCRENNKAAHSIAMAETEVLKARYE